MDKVPPNPQFNTVPASTSIYDRIPVYSQNGQKIILNTSKQPTLFEAYWCPHCQRTLVLLNKNHAKLHDMPVIVSMGFAPGTKLSEAVKISEQEFKIFNIQHVQVYYELNDKEEENLVPQGFPTLVFSRDKQLFSLSGEHTFPIWQKAIDA